MSYPLFFSTLFGSAMGIVIDLKTGGYAGAVDPRVVGAAEGYS